MMKKMADWLRKKRGRAMRLTEEFIKHTDRFKVEPEGHDKRWSVLNAESPEMEVCEFLYSLTRLLKPERVLETGGGTGNSSAYIAQGLKENGKGQVVVIEPFPTSYRKAQNLWVELGVSKYIALHPFDSFHYEPRNERYQMMFLDSEPSCRFTEVKKFYPNLDPGGLILLHDLHHKWGGEWEDFRPLFGDLIRNFDLQVVSLESPRGLVILQKTRQKATTRKYLKDLFNVQPKNSRI